MRKPSKFTRYATLTLTFGAFLNLQINDALSEQISTEEINLQEILIGQGSKASSYYQMLYDFRAAVLRNDETTATQLFSQLELVSDDTTLLQIAKIHLTPESQVANPSTGIELLQRVYNDKASKLRGDAALIAGKYFKSLRYSNDKEKALDWLLKAAELGQHKAHVYLGDLYAFGLERNRDYKQAAFHYKFAAQYISTAPLFAFLRKVARLTHRGEECGIDPYDIAQKHLPALFDEAAAGSLSAAKELGRLFHQGILIEKDMQRAKEWLFRAAKGGDAGAMLDVAKLKLGQAASQEDRSEAISLLKNSGAQGSGAAFAALGKLYLSENKHASDLKAFEYFQKALNAGYFLGLEDLRELYEAERLLGRDLARVWRIGRNLETLSSSIPVYNPPDRREFSGPVSSTSAGIDTRVVGSISSQPTDNLARLQSSGICSFIENTTTGKTAGDTIQLDEK